MKKGGEASKAGSGRLHQLALSDREIEAARTLLRLLAGDAPQALAGREARVENGQRMLAFRQRRMEILNLRAEPPFAILLALYANEPWEPAIPLTRLTLLASVGMSSTLRWLEVLFAEGLIERGDDPDDLRKTMLRLTSKARAKMDKLFGERLES